MPYRHTLCQITRAALGEPLGLFVLDLRDYESRDSLLAFLALSREIQDLGSHLTEAVINRPS